MKEFTVGSFLLHFDAAEDNYRHIRAKFKSASAIAGRDFANRYPALFADSATFAVSLERISAEYLNRGVNTAVNELISHEIIDVDDIALMRHYSDNYLTWLKDVETVRAAYNEIAAEGVPAGSGAALGGGSVMGGGFGVEGAVKGIAIATAANAAIGVATGLISAAGDGLNALATKLRLEKLIASPATLTTLRIGIENLVFNLHRSTVSILAERNPEWKIRPITHEEEVRCSGILCNVRRGRFVGERLERALSQAIMINPYNDQTYFEWQRCGLPLTEGIRALLAYLQIEIGESTEKDENKVASPYGSSDLRSGLLSILIAFKSADFYVAEQIPPRKLRGATAKYFNLEFFTTIDDSGLKDDQILGDLLALIDTTALGSAEEGIAICELGIVWKVGPSSGAYTWEEFTRRRLVAETGMLTIKIGDRRTSNNSQVKNALLVALINSLAGYYQSSRLEI